MCHEYLSRAGNGHFSSLQQDLYTYNQNISGDQLRVRMVTNGWECGKALAIPIIGQIMSAFHTLPVDRFYFWTTLVLVLVQLAVPHGHV